MKRKEKRERERERERKQFSLVYKFVYQLSMEKIYNCRDLL